MKNDDVFPARSRAILAGGLLAGVLDAADALVAYKLAFGLSPLAIYQFVASGLLGPAAYTGGLASGLLGLAIHFLIAFTAAAAYVLVAERVPGLRHDAALWGPLFGVVVFAVMNLLVIPLSRIPPAPVAPALLVNGILGHALLVGLPIALAARRFLGAGARAQLARATT